MKNLFPLLLTLLLLTGCAETYDGPTTTKMVLSETIQEGYWDWGDSAYTYRTVYAYDIYGNQAQWIDYHETEPIGKTVRRYDDRGNLLQDTQYDLEGWFPKKTGDTRYTYDDQNRITSVTHEYRGGDTSSYTITYDDAAHTETTHYAHGTSVRYYSEDGHLLRLESMSSDGTVTVTEYTLRPDGQKASCTATTNGVEDYTIFYEYDDQGRCIRQTHLKDGVESEQRRWEFDDEYHSTTRYDADGSYEFTNYNEDGSMDSSHYFDENGNLQSMTLYRYKEVRIPLERSDTP